MKYPSTIASLLFMNAGAVSVVHADVKPLNFYSTMNFIVQMKLSQSSRDDVLLLGDSITQGLSESGFHFNYVNLGIGGDTSTGLYKRVKLIDLKNYNRALISIGANDLYQGESGVTLGDNIAKVIDLVAPNINKLFVTEVFIPNTAINTTISKDYNIANSKLLESCSRYSNCSVIKLPSTMIGKNGLKQDVTLPDGVHLNSKGYYLWKTQLNKEMADFPVNYYFKFRY